MNDKQPEALRLADWLEASFSDGDKQAAAELRRLHEVNAELVKAAKALIACDFGANGWCPEAESAALRMRSTVAKATGENND